MYYKIYDTLIQIKNVLLNKAQNKPDKSTS